MVLKPARTDTPASPGHLLHQPHHDGSELYVPVRAPGLGDVIPVRLFVPHDSEGEPGATSVTLRAVHDGEPHGSPRNSFAVTVTELEPRDDQVRVRGRTAGGQVLVADVTAPVVGELDLYPGRPVYFAVKATAVTVYPA